MATLRDIRTRIASVQNTQQVTRAMKMVAAAKLRRAQENIFKTRPYAYKIGEIIEHLKRQGAVNAHPLLREHPSVNAALIIVVTGKNCPCLSNSTRHSPRRSCRCVAGSRSDPNFEKASNSRYWAKSRRNMPAADFIALI